MQKCEKAHQSFSGLCMSWVALIVFENRDFFTLQTYILVMDVQFCQASSRIEGNSRLQSK